VLLPAQSIPTIGVASFRQAPTPPRWVQRPRRPRRPMPDGPPPVRTAHMRIVAAVIPWMYFQTVQSRLRELPSRPGHPRRVMRWPPRSARAGRMFPGTSQRFQWLGHRGLLSRFTQGRLHQRTRRRRKTSSYRSRIHPGRASSVESLRARRPGRERRAAIPRRTSPPPIPRVRSRQSPPAWGSDPARPRRPHGTPSRCQPMAHRPCPLGRARVPGGMTPENEKLPASIRPIGVTVQDPRTTAPVPRIGRRSWTSRRTDQRPHTRLRSHLRMDRERKPHEGQWT